MDRKKFYNLIRGGVNLTTQNVQGFKKTLDYGASLNTPTNDLAYILATGWWESAQTMWPVREAFWLPEDWRRRHLRYYPFYGRGLVQTTWEANYRKMSAEMGLPSETLVQSPDLLLRWDYALPALFVGMNKGLYTGKKIRDYVDLIDDPDDKELQEYKGARRVVNGTDKRTEIGRLALLFEKGLRGSGYDVVGLKVAEMFYARGSRGDMVRDIQKKVGILPDGAFGPLTEAAVKGWQAAKDLEVTGRVGEPTLESMNLVQQGRLL